MITVPTIGKNLYRPEREISWPLGGRSVYFRDPAGNSVEYVEGQIW